MKGIDIFCASQAATAIRHTMELPSSSSSSSSSSGPSLLGDGSSSPAIDRCNPIITDSRRALPPTPSQPPPIPKNCHKKKKNQRSTPPSDHDKEMSTRISSHLNHKWSCTKPSEFISPPGSTRYLLSTTLSDLADSNLVNTNHPHPTSHAKPPPPSTLSPNQVVVLRVSLHCRGCERKMRKHISRMEGVTSFNIDFAAKKVTVTGNVTPLEVLSSISKVKNAQLWSPTLSSSTSTPTPMNHVIGSSEFIKNHEFGGDAWVMDKAGGIDSMIS